jgi:hypothetical protein
MLNHLQEAMQNFDFEIANKKGLERPAGYLSHNIMDAIALKPTQLQQAQELNP